MMTFDSIFDTLEKYFKGKNHQLLEPVPLVNDAFPNTFNPSAGHAKALEAWRRKAKVPQKYLSIENCFRHIDLDKIGYANHLSMFYMANPFTIDNPSFEIKKRYIENIHEFFTEILGINHKNFILTVFGGGYIGSKIVKEDIETIKAWNHVGIPNDRILRLGPAQNFIIPQIEGDVSGPKFELFYDRGEAFPEYARYVEIANGEFLPYELEKNNEEIVLKSAGEFMLSACGIGIERLAMIIQESKTIYDIDCFTPIRLVIERHVNSTLKKSILKREINMVIDLIRPIVLIVAEGQFPNESGRGRILKKIIKDILRSIEALEIKNTNEFFNDLIKEVINLYTRFYPNLGINISKIIELLSISTK